MSTSVVYIYTLFDFLVLFLSHSVTVLCYYVSHFSCTSVRLCSVQFASPTNFEGNSVPPADKTRDSREEISVALFYRDWPDKK